MMTDSISNMTKDELIQNIVKADKRGKELEFMINQTEGINELKIKTLKNLVLIREAMSDVLFNKYGCLIM